MRGFVPWCCILFFLYLLHIPYASAAQENDPSYAVAITETPVLNTPDFKSVFGGTDGRTFSMDRYGLTRQIEWIAFSDTVFEIHDTLFCGQNTIYKVTSEEYPYRSETGYFIDSRFVTTYASRPQSREIVLPSKEDILRYLWARQDTHQYVWGGNVSRGVPSLLRFYPPRGHVDTETRDRWMLKGLDCSGLLFEATNGYTPRNTSKLIDCGVPVSIAGRSAHEITGDLQPLDLIVWSGHVIIVLDKSHTIESRARSFNESPDMRGGVYIRDLGHVIRETMNTRIPVDRYEHNSPDKQFVIRRWYDLAENNMQDRTSI